MKKYVVLVLTLIGSLEMYSQDMTKFRLYDPSADASQGIENAVKEAKTQGKHVFIQIGGNWCIWCARFNDFITHDEKIDSVIKASYIIYHLNYSKENFN